MANSNEYMRLYMKRRYERRRADAIADLGGACVDCGIADGLEFDHVDPATKEFSVAKILASGSTEKVKKELAKCVLRCHACHVIKSMLNGDFRHRKNAVLDGPAPVAEMV